MITAGGFLENGKSKIDLEPGMGLEKKKNI